MTLKWVVQRFEPNGMEYYGDAPRVAMLDASCRVCENWREACEAVALAIGPNELQLGVEAKQPVVFERDGVVVVVYMKLDI